MKRIPKVNISKKQMAQTAGAAAHATTQAVGHFATVSAKTAIEPTGVKIVTFFVPFLASTICSMSFVTIGKDIPIAVDLFLGTLGAYLVYSLIFKEKPPTQVQKEPAIPMESE
jgi:hypothetical protein